MTTAAHGSTKAQAAVMATSAANTPLMIEGISATRRCQNEMARAPRAPAAVASNVVKAT